ncbi:MAG: putative toxin-antitoxin system toxin component, PIN family [bacterium]
MTNSIIDEYINVLGRMGLTNKKELRELLLLFQKGFNCIFSNKTPPIKIARDSDDNKFIEAASALNADVIISGDKHLLEIKRYMGINIFTPKEFLDYLKE